MAYDVLSDEKMFREESRHSWISRNENLTPLKEFWIPLKEYCDSIGIEFMTTPMSRLAAEKVRDLVKRWKIGSGSATDNSLLDFINDDKKPVILSTGMSTQKQVDEALKRLNNVSVSLLYCKSLYPCPVEKINWYVMDSMRRVYKRPIGFSDHTVEITTPMHAVIKGEAVIIEKHFTIDKTSWGPDHKFSLNPDELKLAIGLVRDYEQYGEDENILIIPDEEEIKLWRTFRKL